MSECGKYFSPIDGGNVRYTVKNLKQFEENLCLLSGIEIWNETMKEKKCATHST